MGSVLDVCAGLARRAIPVRRVGVSIAASAVALLAGAGVAGAVARDTAATVAEPALAPLARQASIDTVRERLGELSDGSAAVRLAAQRWLALHVDPSRHWSAVDEIAQRGDPEVLRRLAEALAMHDGNLDTAVRAASSVRAELAELGREALAEMLARWSPGLGRAGRRSVDVVGEIGPLDARATLDVERNDLGELLDRLSRSFPGRPALVLDPELDVEVRRLHPDRAAETGPLRGTFAGLLMGLADRFRVEFEGFGFHEPGGQRWIRFCKAGDEGEVTGAELVTRWCVGVATEGGAVREASARALAATGWPAGIAWLELRAAPVGRSVPELEGLLLAAGRGNVAPELVRPESGRALYALADAALRARAPGAPALGAPALGAPALGAPGDAALVDRVAYALLAAGPLGPGGEDLTGIALERWSDLGPRERWLRLVVLEGQRAATPEALAAVTATIEDPTPGDAQASLCFQALRTLRALSVRPPRTLRVGDPQGTWRWVEGHGVLDELVDLLLTLRTPLPDAWQGIGTAPLDGTRAGREALLECALFEALRTEGLEHRARVAERFSAFVAELDEAEASAAIAGWARRGAGALLAGLCEELRAGRRTELDDAVLERLALATGRVPFVRQRELLERATRAATDDADALLTLGALSGGDLRREARGVLLSRLDGGASTGELAAALIRASAAMRDARLEVEQRQFDHNLRGRGTRAAILGEYQRGVRRFETAEPEPVERRERSLALTGP